MCVVSVFVILKNCVEHKIEVKINTDTENSK